MTRAELEEMTKADLIDYADDHDIEVYQHWTKDDIVKEILKGEKKATAKTAAPASHQDEAEPSTADELVAAAAALIKWMEETGHRDHPIVVKARDVLERFE